MDASGSNPNRETDPVSTSRSRAETPDTKRRHILVVEDNQADVYLIQQAIITAGIDADIQVINDGKQAIQFFDPSQQDEATPLPDIVLLDLNLPKNSGDEVLRHLRGTPRGHETCVIIISSSDSPKDRETLRRLGATSYFRKPSDYDEFMKLGQIVRDLLDGIQDDSGST